MESGFPDADEDDVFLLDDPPEPEPRDTSYSVDTGNELPARALVECAVFAEDAARGGCLVMHDLQSLDSPEPPPLDVVGRVTRLLEDGSPDPDAIPGARPSALLPAALAPHAAITSRSAHARVS